MLSMSNDGPLYGALGSRIVEPGKAPDCRVTYGREMTSRCCASKSFEQLQAWLIVAYHLASRPARASPLMFQRLRSKMPEGFVGHLEIGRTRLSSQNANG